MARGGAPPPRSAAMEVRARGEASGFPGAAAQADGREDFLVAGQARRLAKDYDRASSVFTGTINWVQIDLGLDEHDHYVDPEERVRIAMTRQ